MGWAAGVVALTVGAFGMMAAAIGVRRLLRHVPEAAKRPITESNEFLGRIEAVSRVAVVARVTAFLDKRLFVEGAEIKTGDPLYQLERGPFEADPSAQDVAGDAGQRQLTTVIWILLSVRPPYDAALANQQSLEAQIQAAEALVDLSKINLDYTDIRSPIDGRIGRTAVTEGNVVTPNSGTLTTIVSQDPMYVTFPVSVREGLCCATDMEPAAASRRSSSASA